MKTVTLGVLLLSVVPGQGQHDEPWWQRWFGEDKSALQQIQDDEKLLKDAKVSTKTKDLLDFLRSLTPNAGDEKAVLAHCKELGSEKFQEREKATVALIAFGPKIIPLLKQSLPGTPLEVRMRIERCIKALEAKSPAVLASAGVRLVKVRAPTGAVAALLEFAPHAQDEFVAEEILDAVYTLGAAKGKLDAALDTALKDAQPARRAIAAVLLGRFGNDGQRMFVVALLNDKDTEVRLRAAQGLLAKGERTALPVLVEILKQAPYGLAERAEEILVQAAGPTAPKAALGTEEAARKKCYEAWREWLPVHMKDVNLAKLDIGFPLPNAEFRAREAARQMVEIILKPKEATAAKVARLTEVPFYLFGALTINTRQEWEDHLKRDNGGQENVQFKCRIVKIEPLTDYLSKANPKDKDFLVKFSAAEVRVAHLALDIDVNMQNPTVILNIPVFVRVSGARGRIFGFGEPQQPFVGK
jgi:hypothetical protein